MLRVVEIEYIKGISQKRFALDILPNKPSLLVAPNGFGKSSIATAFNSMNSRRIILDEDNQHSGNPAHNPRIFVEYSKPDTSIVQLEATSNSNTISSEFDYFVINNLTKAKGIGSPYGGATATLEIKDVVLIDRIPANVKFSYSYRDICRKFGVCSRVLPNISNDVLTNLLLIEKLSDEYQALERANGERIQNRINAIINEINAQRGTADEIIEWIRINHLNDLQQINYLNTIGNLINEFDIGYNSEVKSYLAAIQLIWNYNTNQIIFKNACTYNNYRLDRKRFDDSIQPLSTWKKIRSSESGGKLTVKFPGAHHISNGQRDILTFISMLFRAKRHLKKRANILIIDEVFDYLDDANLTAAQFYVTKFIDEYKTLGKRIYPLILTHLNPNYFKNYAFNKQKVYYLEQSTIQVSQNMINLLRNRGHASLGDDVSKYLLHFNPGAINKRAEFRALNIAELWGVGNNFIQHIYNEVSNYLEGQPYDPFAVCGGVRLKIEETAYNKLQGEPARADFLSTHKTRSKLEKAEEMGVDSPESHYLLGIIYNEGMHWKNNQDNVSPIASKLENLTIKKLIEDIFAN
ncbi:MAG: hypothetical protein N4A74_02685 [Carboxylicivirga sp.]|jgi:energy-coupling factor transporter ATP-binding protein EcfA2|nr:hypothetical protein [Carboxylicivirga sp.]